MSDPKLPPPVLPEVTGVTGTTSKALWGLKNPGLVVGLIAAVVVIGLMFLVSFIARHT